MRRLVTLLVLLSVAVAAFSKDTKKVTASYTYNAPESVSLEEAKRIALERAKTEAIENAYGTHVSRISITSTETSGGDSSTAFSSYGGSGIHGEWIETTDGPEYDIKYIDNTLVVTVTVSGIIRKIDSQQVDIDVHLLKNGIEPRCESYDFVSGDEMYLSFSASTQGYLIVYLVDGQSAYRLLPYRKQTEPSLRVTSQDPMLFFHKASADPSRRRIVDEYILTANRPQEINSIYIIFSTNDLYKAVDYQVEKGLPRELSVADFHRWLGNARRQDEKIVVKELPITIRQKQ